MKRCLLIFCAMALHGLGSLQPVAAQQPQLAIQTGHSALINAVAYRPDGRIIASAGVDIAIKLWDTQSGLELRALQGHSAAVQSLSFSPDGRILASGGADNVIKLWDIVTGRVLRTLQGHDMAVTSLAFSADGRTLASGGMDQTIRVWDAATGELRTVLLTDDKPVFQGLVLMALSRDGRTLISGGEIVKLWDAATGKELRTLRHRNPPGSPPDLAIALSPDGKSVAIAGITLSLLDATTGQVRWQTKLEGGGIESLEFSPDGKTLAGAGNDIIFWNAANGQQLKKLPPINDHSKIAFSRDGRSLGVGGGNTREFSVRIIDTATGEELRKMMGHTSPVTSVSFSADGRLLANGRRTNIARKDTVKLWDVANGQMLRTLSGSTLRMNDLAFSGDGRVLAGSGGVYITLWEAATGRVLQKFSENPRNIDALAFSGDGRLLASADRSGAVRITDAATGKPIHQLKGHASATYSLSFSPDAKLLASGGHDQLIRMWNTATGAEVRALAGHTNRVLAVTFSPNGALLASSGLNQPVKLWNPQTGQLQRTLPTLSGAGNFRINSLAFSPDGKLLAGGVQPIDSIEGGALLWDVATGKLLYRLSGVDDVGSVAFSPDGRLIAGGSADTSIRLWEAKTGRLLASLLSLDDSDWLVVTPDGLFDGSPAAWSQILWRFSPQLFDVAPVEAFFNEYFYPGLLSELFAGKRPKAVATLERKDRRQPQLQLTIADGAASPTTNRRVKVRLSIVEAPAGAQDVRLFRNGALVKTWQGDALKGQSQAALETELQITAGQNRLTAYAFNRDNVKSRDATLTVLGADTLKRPATAYVLAVGLNRYANSQFDLSFAVADATDFAAEFQQQQKKLKSYARIELIPLQDQQATKNNILQALGKIAAQAQPEDAVVMYFAGHGTAEQQQFYLIPHDLGYSGDRDQLDEAGLKLVLERSISDRELEHAFETVNAGRILIVIDACNSGQALEAAEKRRGPMNSKGLAQLAYEKGMYVLAAAQSYQAAIEPADLKHGLLTYTLVEEGLKRTAADIQPTDGTILLREWLDYATERVPQIQRERMGKSGGRGGRLAYVEGEEDVSDPEQRNVQRPRVFYRRELEAEPFIVFGETKK